MAVIMFKKKSVLILVLIIVGSIIFYLYHDEQLIQIKNLDYSLCGFTSSAFNVGIDDNEQLHKENYTADIINNVEQLSNIINCNDIHLIPRIVQRGNYWLLYNYVRARRNFRCFESVTYTTQGDYWFLDNLIPLVKRWKGPISVAIHAPGDDFILSLKTIAYLRNCETKLIREYVTFHLFFETEYIPVLFNESISNSYSLYNKNYDCSKGSPFKNINTSITFKSRNNILYPINVARNVARQTVQTYFVLASDIELYPSVDLIKKFLDMILRNKYLLLPTNKIFVLPVFEIESSTPVPQNKTELQKLLAINEAQTFHVKICKTCHAVPSIRQWMRSEENAFYNIFTIVKRLKKYNNWEAFYIGTNNDPLFDERLSWEGQRNKMTQAYAMCLLNYDYMVLDNAFLVHRPGIKKEKDQVKHYPNLVKNTTIFVKTVIKSEMNAIYGNLKGCKL